MTQTTADSIPKLLIRSIPRNLVLAIEEALDVGARRAYLAAKGMNEGHLAHAVGQLRHFHMNESFQRALEAGNASPSPVKGNSVITGRSGMFSLGRFNIKSGYWVNGRRSTTRLEMSSMNSAIEPLVQPDLLEQYTQPSNAVVFFVSCFSGSMKCQPESPQSIQIAVPNRDMTGWLFKEPIAVFLHRYEQMSEMQEDRARPKLKLVKKLQDVGDES